MTTRSSSRTAPSTHYVNFSDLAWYEFALPPLEEQRRIAEVLDASRNAGDNYGFAIRAVDILIRALERATLEKLAQHARWRTAVLSQLN